MSVISSLLGKLIKKYQEDANNAERASRLVLPGITSNIASEIHSDLMKNSDFVSYLVVDKDGDLAPDERNNLITPKGLTSKRLDSFVAITNPNQLSKIPDSIKGSGGSTRSEQYSEEWPWIDNKSVFNRYFVHFEL